MHYGFKSTPTWTMRGRPQSKSKLIQLPIQRIPGLQTMQSKSHCIIREMCQQLLNRGICIKSLSRTLDLAVITPSLTLLMGKRDL